MSRIGIIGFGSFGQFMAKNLTFKFEIEVFDEVDKTPEATEIGVKQVDMETICDNEILIFCIPVQYLEAFLKNQASKVRETSILIDVSSVKVYPLQLLQSFFPKNQLIGLHPLFGPQSAKSGIAGHNIVVCKDDCKYHRAIAHFLSCELRLNVLFRSPELHDQQMGYVQGLTHLVGRAVNEMDIPDVEQKTRAYDYLLDLKKTLGRDSMDLFITIEKYNPFAAEIRKQFLEELKKLDEI